MEYTRLILEMEAILCPCEIPPLKEFPFRSRIRHTHRVMKWVQRLLETTEADRDVVMCACIFHDIGYVKTAPHGTHHAAHSTEMFSAMLDSLNLPLTAAQIASVMECIRWHSQKDWLADPSVELSPELQLLMEADILDECGPIALIWDAMAEGLLPDPSFLRTYERMQESAPPYIDHNPCRSAAARYFWEQQQDVHRRFLSSYHKDLGLDLDPSWKEPYQAAFDYMYHCMEKQDLVPNRYGVIFPFRRRSLHMERVACWAYRLSTSYPQLRRDILMHAAILHDIGYSVDTDGVTHAYSSVPLVRTYLESIAMPEADIQFICRIIEKHSDKSYLDRNDNELYFQLLIEADHLDETGAMSLSWDAMASMNVSEPSYANTAAHIARFTLKMLHEFPLKTEEGQRIWAEKQQLVDDFYKLLLWNLEEY